jgi:hypothetical protein
MDTPAVVVMFFLIFGGGTMVSRMWSDYNKTRLEMARLKFDQKASAPVGSSREIEALKAELEATRQELRNLRDTSMQYDISFDTALGRMENRVAHVERRVGVNASGSEAETVTLTGR